MNAKPQIFSIFLLLIFSMVKVSAQKNTIFLEAFGWGGYGSLNYGRTIYNLPNLPIDIGTQIGIGSFKQKDINHQFNPDIFLPIGVNAQFNYKKHSLEFGISHTIASVLIMDLSKNTKQYRTYTHNGGMLIGYKLRLLKHPNLYLRIAYTPILEQYQHYRHWAGLSMGIKF